MASGEGAGGVGGFLRPLAYGVYAAVIVVVSVWVLGAAADILDLRLLTPLSKAFYANILWFSILVAGFHYVRWLRRASGGAAWVVRPLELTVLVAGLSWSAGLALKAVNEDLKTTSLAQAGSILADNLLILSVLAAGVLYLVAVLEKVFAR